MTDDEERPISVSITESEASADDPKWSFTDAEGNQVVLRPGQEREVAQKLEETLAPLSPEKRQEVFDKMSAEMARWKEATRIKKEMETELAAVQEMRRVHAQWSDGAIRLERPDGSATYKLLAAIRAGVVRAHEDVQTQLSSRHAALIQGAVPFVIEHDWAAAFAGAHDFAEGDYKLPFDAVVFEFRADAHRAFVLTTETEGIIYLHRGDYWYAAPWSRDDVFGAQVRAVCIALDAEAAVAETVRAPEKLNKSRAAKGSPPLLDYHVVRLARRERASALPDDDRTTGGARKRLHFVRGHWRHYETHKTWIKWHLRGDPDLGFIDKHYRL